jgi:CubicO group peptidase (beta-lactamase class C family)
MTKRLLRLHTIVLVILLSLPVQVPAQTPSAPANFAGFDSFVEQVMKDWKVPGLALAVVKDGQIVYAKGYGYRDVKNGLKVTPDTLFAIGSCSKAFTAAAIGILVDEGKLEWDKPVRTYLPDFTLWDEYASAHLTVRDLITHQSGLPRHDLLWYGSPLSRQELFERLRYLEPSKPLHGKYQYNNLMFMTAGVLIGKVSGGTWEEFVQRRLLDPLGMKSTRLSVRDLPQAADASLPYNETNDEIKAIPYRNIDAIGPAGSINSSVNEMSHWLVAQLDKGKYDGKQVISEASLRENHTPQIVSGGEPRYDEQFYSSYGMGWGVTAYRGHPVLAHSGGIDGFISQVRLLPKDKIGLVVLTNSGTNVSAVVANNIIDRMLGLNEVPWAKRAKDDQAKSKEAQAKAKSAADATRKIGTHPSHDLKDFTGQFEHPAYGVLTIMQEGEGMKSERNGVTASMKHFHYDIFQLVGPGSPYDGMKIMFQMNKAGDIDRVAVPLEPSVKDIIFTRRAEPMAKSALEKLTGDYDMSGNVVKIWLRGENTLIASVPSQPDVELRPVKNMLFNVKGLEGYSVEFKLDAAGKVTEALLVQPGGSAVLKRK